jgi:hypothetical protein
MIMHTMLVVMAKISMVHHGDHVSRFSLLLVLAPGSAEVVAVSVSEPSSEMAVALDWIL